MKLIKKFTPVIVRDQFVNDSVNAHLTFGNGDRGYYRENPREEFDTEDEAIQHAFKVNSWENWIILPIIKFDNF